jgi:hypothetical protein
MTRMRWVALTWLVLCCGLSALWGFSMIRTSGEGRPVRPVTKVRRHRTR